MVGPGCGIHCTCNPVGFLVKKWDTYHICSLENLNCEFHIKVGDGPIPHMLCSMKANGCHVWFEQNVHSHTIHVWYIYLHVVDFLW